MEDWPKWTTLLAKASEHGRIIAAAAKAALAPIGCVRKGQSRVWYSDQRYWLIAVEFQPSGWSKGSYLNIFVAWLWKENGGFDIYYRPVFFVPFQNAEQFTLHVVHMAETAAREVVVQRERFSSFEQIYEHLLSQSHRTPWPKYNAAIAAGLARPDACMIAKLLYTTQAQFRAVRLHVVNGNDVSSIVSKNNIRPTI